MDLELRKEVWSHFRKTQVAFLATSAENQPYVRPLTLIYFKEKFWITTFSGDAKIAQIKQNEKIEVCVFLKKDQFSGYIRGLGEATIITDIHTKKNYSTISISSKNSGIALMLMALLCLMLIYSTSNISNPVK